MFCFFVSRVSKKRDEIHREGIAVDEAKLKATRPPGGIKEMSTESQTS